jgi:predicted PurR-regulated permease PerM
MRTDELRGIRRAVTVLATLAALALLEQARAFAVPVAFGIFLAKCLEPLVGWLARSPPRRRGGGAAGFHRGRHFLAAG